MAHKGQRVGAVTRRISTEKFKKDLDNFMLFNHLPQYSVAKLIGISEVTLIHLKKYGKTSDTTLGKLARVGLHCDVLR